MDPSIVVAFCLGALGTLASAEDVNRCAESYGVKSAPIVAAMSASQSVCVTDSDCDRYSLEFLSNQGSE